MNPGLAKALGVMMKLDFQRFRPQSNPCHRGPSGANFRQVFFPCDEYRHFATVGENEPTGDEKFFSLSRQPKYIPIGVIPHEAIAAEESRLDAEKGRKKSRGGKARK
jgi:hypothetical protein